MKRRNQLKTSCLWASLLAVLTAACATGCHRQFYRLQADADVYELIGEKTGHPHFPLNEFGIEIDPRSRMFDPFNPDHPPMPEDDPLSHKLMECVDCKRGYPHWHDQGIVRGADNPHWRDYLPLNHEGELVLDEESAVKLALVHSTDYQSQYETLYFSALDVSSERFLFDTQFFGGYGADYRASGDLSGRPRSRLSLRTPDGIASRLEARKFFTTGADLVAGLANSLVWDFHGPNVHSVNTVLDFTLVQPLLRNAGRDRILERLTRSERLLLANVRLMERFRRGFYLEVTTGRNAGSGASRAGGVFGAAGLGGFTGVGGGGFGGLGGGGGGGGGIGGLGAGNVGGYLGLLQDQQDIRNQEANVAGLRESLLQLQETLQGRLDTNLNEGLQIVQAQQALFDAQSSLLTSKTVYQTTLDGFKATLGLPPDVPVRIEDPMIEQFNLIDTAIVPVQNRISDLRLDVGNTNERILSRLEVLERDGNVVQEIPWSDELELQLRQLRSRIQLIARLQAEVLDVNVVRAQQDIEKMSKVLPRRAEELVRLKEKFYAALESAVEDEEASNPLEKVEVDIGVFDGERLKALPRELNRQLPEIRQALESHRPQLKQIAAAIDELLQDGGNLPTETRTRKLVEGVVLAIPGLLSEFSEDVLELSLLQARARTESVELVQIDLEWQQGLEIARQYRRDWMNARAALVDAWRLIEFNADNLEGFVNVVFSGDIGNVGKNPVKFQDATGQLRVGLQFDAPITRLQERNTYRQSLVEYAQARRGYYQVEDSISAGIRNEIRTIDLNQVNFEARRMAVLIAIRQIEINRYIQSSPPRPGQTQQLGVTAARDIVSALSDLQRAQNSFLGVWLTYETLRRGLDLDLGTMQLDEHGLWIDPGPIGGKHGLPGVPYNADCMIEQMPPLDQFIPLDEDLTPIEAEPIDVRKQPQEGIELEPDASLLEAGEPAPEAPLLQPLQAEPGLLDDDASRPSLEPPRATTASGSPPRKRNLVAPAGFSNHGAVSPVALPDRPRLKSRLRR